MIVLRLVFVAKSASYFEDKFGVTFKLHFPWVINEL